VIPCNSRTLAMHSSGRSLHYKEIVKTINWDEKGRGNNPPA
jgi:hypothetical protein